MRSMSDSSSPCALTSQTYVVPIIPLIVVVDGYVSATRTREMTHVGLGFSSSLSPPRIA